MFIYVYVIYVFNATVKLWVLSWIQKHHSVFLAPVGFHTLRLLDSLQLLSTRLNRILFASHLQVKGHHPKLRQVGVFLDMEEGQVSLYNVKSGSEIYSFHTSTEFTERMFPLLGTGDKEVPLILLTTLQHPAWGTGTRTGTNRRVNAERTKSRGTAGGVESSSHWSPDSAVRLETTKDVCLVLSPLDPDRRWFCNIDHWRTMCSYSQSCFLNL